jgi:anti-anti-sigma factor
MSSHPSPIEGTLVFVNSQLGDVASAQRDGTNRFRLSGEFDLSNAYLIQDALMSAIRHGSDDIVVDLSAVRFMDAQLLRSLIRAKAAAAARDIAFVVVPPSDSEVWRVARLIDFPLAA